MEVDLTHTLKTDRDTTRNATQLVFYKHYWYVFTLYLTNIPDRFSASWRSKSWKSLSLIIFYKNKMASLKYRKFKTLPTYFSGKLRNKSYFIKSDHNQISVLLFIVHVKVYVHPRVDETIQVCISWNTFGRKQIYNIY